MSLRRRWRSSRFPKTRTGVIERGGIFDWPMMTTRKGEVVDGSRIPPPESRGSDELCFIDLEEGWYSLTDTQRKVGFALEWDLGMFPYLWFWQVFGGGRGYPWYGRCYNCALEPNASATTYLRAVAHSGASRVAKVENERVIPA